MSSTSDHSMAQHALLFLGPDKNYMFHTDGLMSNWGNPVRPKARKQHTMGKATGLAVCPAGRHCT